MFNAPQLQSPIMIRQHSRSVSAAVLTAVLVACGGGGAATTADTTSTTAGTTTTETSAATTTTTAETTTTTTASDGATTTTRADCPAAAEPASGWRFLSTPDWVFYHPGDWEDVSTQTPPQTAGLHFDSVTLGEAGVDEAEELVTFVIASPDRLQALLLTSLEGPTSPLEDVYQRAEDRYSSSEAFEEMIAPGVAGCLGGEPALHVGFMTAGSYQESWFVYNGDTLFHADFFGVTEDDSEILAELLATWEFEEQFAALPSGDAFVEVAMADEVDVSIDAPDPSWYTDQFTTASPAVYVVFRLPVDTSGTVKATWSSEGTELFSHDFFYQTDHTWAYMAITPPAGGFSAGAYQVELVLDEDVARVVLDFTIAEA